MKENDSLHKVNTEGLRRLKTDVLRLTISSSIIFSATGIFLVNIFKSNQINFILFIKFSYQYHSHTNFTRNYSCYYKFSFLRKKNATLKSMYMKIHLKKFCSSQFLNLCPKHLANFEFVKISVNTM